MPAAVAFAAVAFAAAALYAALYAALVFEELRLGNPFTFRYPILLHSDTAEGPYHTVSDTCAVAADRRDRTRV